MTNREAVFDLFIEAEAGVESARRIPMGDRVTIGSHPANQVVLADTTVAPFHCTLDFLGLRQEPVRPSGVSFSDTSGRTPTVAPANRALPFAWRVLDHGAEAPRMRAGEPFASTTFSSARGRTYVGNLEVTDAELREAVSLRIGRSRLAIVARERFGLVRLLDDRRGSRTRTAEAERFVLRVARAARASAPALLEGLPAARAAVAAEIARDNGPFRTVSCAAADAGTALQAALATTGGGENRWRYAEAPPQAPLAGTVYLDDVDRLTPAAQLELLHHLRVVDGAFRSGPRTGVRLLAGTTAPLASVVASGRFRSDLFERLAVLPLTIPARPPEPPRPFAAAKSAVIETFERNYAEAVLAWSDGHVAQAAKRSGLNRASLYRLLERLERTR